MTQGATTTESYTYDSVGNRLTSLGVPSYTYNSSNELTATLAASYTYDNNGNTLSKTVSGATTQYAWDFDDRLTTVALPGSGGTATFKHDPMGRRVQKAFTVGSTTNTTNYVYDGANTAEEVDQNGTVLARYTQGTKIDEPLSELRSGTSSYYEQDGLGSVTSLSGSAGAQGSGYVYDGFGNLTNSTGSLSNPFQYAGRDYDPETSLRYYRARYYDPSAGRFLSEDTVGFASGPNFYSYVRNSPIGSVDPLGLQNVATASGASTTAGTAVEVTQAEVDSYIAQLERQLACPKPGSGGPTLVLLTMDLDLLEHDIREGRKLLQLYGVIAPDPPAPKFDPPLVLPSPDIMKQLGTLTDKEIEYQEYKKRCYEKAPGGLTGCHKKIWELQRNTDCRDMRYRWDEKYMPGRHATNITELNNSILNGQDWIKRNCK